MGLVGNRRDIWPGVDVPFLGAAVLLALTLVVASSGVSKAAATDGAGAPVVISALGMLPDEAAGDRTESGSPVLSGLTPCTETCVLRCTQSVCASGGSAVVDDMHDLTVDAPVVSTDPHGIVPTVVFFSKILRPPRGRDGSLPDNGRFGPVMTASHSE